MTLWNEKLNKHKDQSNAQSSSIVEEQVTTHAISVGKEIDWEERHFQICLAMLSCPVCNSHGHPDAPMLRHVVAQANKMVELLKQNVSKTEEQSLPTTSKSEAKAENVNEEKATSSDGKSLKPKTPFIELFEDLDMERIWEALNKLGYDRGSDIPYFHFNECCEELDIDVDSIDIDKFSELYEVNIG